MVGFGVGDAVVGFGVGLYVGDGVGFGVGIGVGASGDGGTLGTGVGLYVGDNVGLGESEGAAVGCCVGRAWQTLAAAKYSETVRFQPLDLKRRSLAYASHLFSAAHVGWCSPHVVLEGGIVGVGVGIVVGAEGASVG